MKKRDKYQQTDLMVNLVRVMLQDYPVGTLDVLAALKQVRELKCVADADYDYAKLMLYNSYGLGIDA